MWELSNRRKRKKAPHSSPGYKIQSSTLRGGVWGKYSLIVRFGAGRQVDQEKRNLENELGIEWVVVRGTTYRAVQLGEREDYSSG